MPCRDDGAFQDDCVQLQKRCDSLTEMLCRLCSQMDARGEVLPDDIGRWWVQHDKADKERIRQEALSKLTKKEKEVLGLE